MDSSPERVVRHRALGAKGRAGGWKAMAQRVYLTLQGHRRTQDEEQKGALARRLRWLVSSHALKGLWFESWSRHLPVLGWSPCRRHAGGSD